MRYRRNAWLCACLALVLMMPAAALATSADERIAELEARIAELEAQLDALQPDGEAPDDAPPVNALQLGETIELTPGTTVTFTEYSTGNRFRYSPAGGFSTLTLSAKSGYRLLCLFATVENGAQGDLATAQLLNVTVSCGKEYTSKAQDSFFYENALGMYAGGLKSIGPKTAVNGCLLFAVPEDIETSRERIAVQMVYGDVTYECVLRPAGALLEAGEATPF